MRRIIMVVAALVLGVGLGCEDKKTDRATTAQAGQSKGPRQFGVTFQTMNNPFFVELEKGMKEVIEAKGDRIITLDAQYKSDKQLNDISDLIQRNVTAIFINPVNWEGIKGSLLKARDRKIPCIVVDAPVKDEQLVLCQVASDNIEAGRLACRELAKVKPNAEVGILHLSTNKACIDRVAGFKEEAAKHPGMKILATQDGGNTREKGRPLTEDMLARFPEMDAIFPINDPGALGAVSALESAGKLDKVTVVTVDGSKDAIDAIKAGKLHSTSAQFPREIGRIAAQKMYDHLDGKPVEKDVKVRVELINKDNADKFQASY